MTPHSVYLFEIIIFIIDHATLLFRLHLLRTVPLVFLIFILDFLPFFQRLPKPLLSTFVLFFLFDGVVEVVRLILGRLGVDAAPQVYYQDQEDY